MCSFLETLQSCNKFIKKWMIFFISPVLSLCVDPASGSWSWSRCSGCAPLPSSSQQSPSSMVRNSSLSACSSVTMMMMMLVHLLLHPSRGQQRPSPEHTHTHTSHWLNLCVNYWTINHGGLISLCLGTINLMVIHGWYQSCLVIYGLLCCFSFPLFAFPL